LNPTLFVYTPLGKGRCLFLIDYGMDINTCWVVALNSGIIKHFDSNDIILEENYTFNTKSEVPKEWK
jgi:hypothetical protein